MLNGEKMKFGKLHIDPAKNPSVLDTATWDPESAWRLLSSIGDWPSVLKRSRENTVNMNTPIVYETSKTFHMGNNFFLMRLNDGQHVFIEIGENNTKGPLGKPYATKSLSNNDRMAMYKTDAEIINRYVTEIKPDKGPKVLGQVPRLGIGTRMSTSVWPAVWSAMDQCDFSANAIQNSLRELNTEIY